MTSQKNLMNNTIMTKENEAKRMKTRAYKMLENRKYRQRKRIIEKREWISAHLSEENAVWLTGYHVSLNHFHDFFEFITKIDKTENPYTECIFVLI